MNRRGFTLVELMIVVVIIGILAAIAIPKFNVAAHQSKEKEADVILKQVQSLQHAYKAARGDFAESEADLLEVGFEPPTRMEFYEWEGQVDFPICLTAKGDWNNRGIDEEGNLDTC